MCRAADLCGDQRTGFGVSRSWILSHEIICGFHQYAKRRLSPSLGIDARAHA